MSKSNEFTVEELEFIADLLLERRNATRVLRDKCELAMNQAIDNKDVETTTKRFAGYAHFQDELRTVINIVDKLDSQIINFDPNR